MIGRACRRPLHVVEEYLYRHDRRINVYTDSKMDASMRKPPPARPAVALRSHPSVLRRCRKLAHLVPMSAMSPSPRRRRTRITRVPTSSTLTQPLRSPPTHRSMFLPASPLSSDPASDIDYLHDSSDTDTGSPNTSPRSIAPLHHVTSDIPSAGIG